MKYTLELDIPVIAIFSPLDGGPSIELNVVKKVQDVTHYMYINQMSMKHLIEILIRKEHVSVSKWFYAADFVVSIDLTGQAKVVKSRTVNISSMGYVFEVPVENPANR